MFLKRAGQFFLVHDALSTAGYVLRRPPGPNRQEHLTAAVAREYAPRTSQRCLAGPEQPPARPRSGQLRASQAGAPGSPHAQTAVCWQCPRLCLQRTVSTHTRTHTHTHMLTCTHTLTHAHTCARTCTQCSHMLTCAHMFTRVHTHAHACTHTHMLTCACTRTCTHMLTHEHTLTHADMHMHAHMFTNTCAHTCSRAHAHTPTCSHMHTHTCSPIHTCTHIQTCSHAHTYPPHTCTHTCTHTHAHCGLVISCFLGKGQPQMSQNMPEARTLGEPGSRADQRAACGHLGGSGQTCFCTGTTQ